MSLVELLDDGLLLINDPSVSVSGLLEEAPCQRHSCHLSQQNHLYNNLTSKSDKNKNNNNNNNNNNTSGMYLQRIWIENDEIAQKIQQRPWKSLEIVSCQGSEMPHLVATALRQQSLQKFALRKIASRLENCIHAMRISGLKHVLELTLEVALSERSCQSLASALDTTCSPCSLVDLKLERSSFIIPSALSAFAEGLKYNTSLKSLSLIKCKLRDDDLQVLMPCLPSSLHSLDLTGNFCRNQLAEIILQSNLPVINLTNQHPGEFGGSLDLSTIGPAIASNTTLQSLDLSFNMLTLDDVRGLVDVLANTTNVTLETLNLMNNQLDDLAIQYIGSKLPGMYGLKRLDITANRFGDYGAAALLHGLRQNCYLCHLHMPRGFEEDEDIRFLLALNRAGRRLVQQCFDTNNNNNYNNQDHSNIPTSSKQSRVPLGLWPFIFGRVNMLALDDEVGLSNKNMQASVMFFLLQEGPIWIGREQ
jgi:hypothetical protein